MHGAHRSRNVLQDKDHPQYKNGERTKEAETERRRASTALLTLRDIGDSINLFNGRYTRGRKPGNYQKFNMSDESELIKAIILTLGK
jgi:hypothetical protein